MAAVPRGGSFSYASSGASAATARRTNYTYESGGVTQAARGSFAYESSAAAPATRSSLSYETTPITAGYTTSGAGYASGAGYTSGAGYASGAGTAGYASGAGYASNAQYTTGAGYASSAAYTSGTTGYTSQYAASSQGAYASSVTASQYGGSTQNTGSQMYRNYEPEGSPVATMRYQEVASPSRYPRDTSRRGTVDPSAGLTSVIYGAAKISEPLTTTQHMSTTQVVTANNLQSVPAYDSYSSIIDGYSQQVADGTYTYSSSVAAPVGTKTINTQVSSRYAGMLKSGSIQQLDGGVTVMESAWVQATPVDNGATLTAQTSQPAWIPQSMDGGATLTSQSARIPQSSDTYTAPTQSSGTYPIGSIVEYNSKSLSRWIMARVEKFNAEDCLYDLDCKPGVPPERIRWPASIGPNTGSAPQARPSQETDYFGGAGIPKVLGPQRSNQPTVMSQRASAAGGAKYMTYYYNGAEYNGYPEPETDSTRSGSSTEPQAKFQGGYTETVLYRCPECQQGLPTLEEAVAHCSAKREAQQATAAQQSAAHPGQAVPTALQPNFGLPEGTTLVECDRDKNAEPVITRQVDPDTGIARTIVKEEDGSERVFGENTVQSLITSSDETAEAWVDALTIRQLRGLVHEVGQRLISYSQTVQERIKTRSELQEEINYMALGLSPHASLKELEAAYKKLAKRMHPDKNGGTEEAKQRFQYMKERYEAIRASRKKKGIDKNIGYDHEDVEHPFQGGAIEDGEAPPEEKTKREKEAYDEDSDKEEEVEEKSKDPGIVSYDPNCRESLNETIWKMMKDLRSLDAKLETLDQDIDYLAKESSVDSHTARFGKEMAEAAGTKSVGPTPKAGNAAEEAAQAFEQVQEPTEPESYDEPVLPPKSFAPGGSSPLRSRPSEFGRSANPFEEAQAHG